MSDSQSPPPMFNLPDPLKILGLTMLLIHLPRVFGLDGLDNDLFAHLAFVPLRYQGFGYLTENLLATVISPLGYSLLHADWLHLLINLGMLIAFGKVVCDVCGTRAFVVLYCIGALAGSGIVLAATQDPRFSLIGASAAISALVGAIACLGIMQRHRLPSPFNSRKRSVQFLLIWIGLNLLLAVLPHAAFASSFAIAWHAHLAGLAAGYFYAWVGLRNYRLDVPKE